MDLYTIVQVCLCSSIFGYVFVNELTQNRQLLDFIRGYYEYLPNVLVKILNCDKCFSGWVSLISVIVMAIYNYNFSLEFVFRCFFCPILSIFVILLIKRILR